MADDKIAIYAELLPNLRQISLAITLPSPSDASTRAAITSRGRAVRATHRGVAERVLRLPGAVAAAGFGDADMLLPVQKHGLTGLAYRLPLLPGGGGGAVGGTTADATPPWSAREMRAGTEVRCRRCGRRSRSRSRSRSSDGGSDYGVLVRAGAVRVWKDLPSENWAEMMEFWHCHKPGEHHAHDRGHDHGGGDEHGDGDGTGDEPERDANNGRRRHAEKADEASLAARGYGANSAISAREGVGFVDLTTFWLAEGDCQGVTFSLSGFADGSTRRETLDIPSSDPSPRSLNVFCSTCQTQVGYFNFRTAAVTLFKWQILCQPMPTADDDNGKAITAIPPPGVSECLAATIAATIARSGSSKSLVTPMPENVPAAPAPAPADERVLHIWVLNGGISYASTEDAGEGGGGDGDGDARSLKPAIPAMKLLYQLISRAEAEKMLESVVTDAQEINLPRDAIASVIDLLERSNTLLPPAERGLKEWKVGLLKR